MLEDKPQFEYHSNHIVAGQKMIDIFEDEAAPNIYVDSGLKFVMEK